jgi:hypothetical protein
VCDHYAHNNDRVHTLRALHILICTLCSPLMCTHTDTHISLRPIFVRQLKCARCTSKVHICDTRRGGLGRSVSQQWSSDCDIGAPFGAQEGCAWGAPPRNSSRAVVVEPVCVHTAFVFLFIVGGARSHNIRILFADIAANWTPTRPANRTDSRNERAKICSSHTHTHNECDRRTPKFHTRVG